MRNRGFTLTEILVVGAIMAILAAVAIPTYTGYVQTQRQAVVANIAQAAAVSANAYWRRTGANPPSSASLNLFLPDPAKYTITISGSSVVVAETAAPSITATVAFR